MNGEAERVFVRYPNVDQALLHDCRNRVLGMVAVWRWGTGDQFLNGREAARKLPGALREGAPLPALARVMRDCVSFRLASACGDRNAE